MSKNVEQKKAKAPTPAEALKASEIRKRYIERKAFVLNQEKKNFKYIILYGTSDFECEGKVKYYAMAENSAIMYAAELSKRMKRKSVKLHHDSDRGHTVAKLGVALIRDFEALKRDFAKLDIKQFQPKNAPDHVFGFTMPYAFTENDIKDMIESIKMQKEEINKLIYAKNLYPAIYKKILKVERDIIFKIKKTESFHRDLFGQKIAELCVGIFEKYSEMSHGKISVEAAAQAIKKYIAKLKVQIAAMGNTDAWDVETCMSVGRELSELDYMVEKEMLQSGKSTNR